VPKGVRIHAELLEELRALHTTHCYHNTSGPIMIALKDGHVHQTCCMCPATRAVHWDHAHEKAVH
jgi:hypothetical protein